MAICDISVLYHFSDSIPYLLPMITCAKLGESGTAANRIIDVLLSVMVLLGKHVY